MVAGKYARRVDDNQPEMVRLFRKLGAQVLVLSSVGSGCPDLLILCAGQLQLVEIKDGRKPLSAQKLTPLEQKFIDEWGDAVSIVRNDVDAIQLVRKMRGII